jgi:hypothetical protein
MAIGSEFAALFRRDLAKLARQLEHLDDAHLWEVRPGVSNSAGNPMLHLNGNLREYIGRQLGGEAYTRERPREFADSQVSRERMAADLAELVTLVPRVLEGLPAERWEATYPENVLGEPLSTRHFVAHLYGHFNYHLGQIDYLRRLLTGQGSLTQR